MKHDSLVGINIVDIPSNKLLNRTGTPLLFYWNGENDVLDDLKGDKELSDYCKVIFADPSKYLLVKICYFFFKYGTHGEELFNDNEVTAQDILLLKDFDSGNIVKYFLLKHFKSLYEISFKEPYSADSALNTTIIDIYNQLKNKFKSRISKPTIINWLRSMLLETNQFNTENTNYIIAQLENILKDID